MKKQQLFILIWMFLLVSCLNNKNSSEININGNWYYIESEYDDIIEGYDYVELFFNNTKGYKHSYANDFEKLEYKIYNDTLFSTENKDLDYGLINNFTKKSFTLTFSDENIKMFNISNNEGLFTLEDYINKKCSFEEYYDSYYKRKRKYYYKK